jgi:pimeloyl-ACP methyl ester carboxylesterase
MISPVSREAMIMAPEIRYASNGKVSIAYETFGDPATGEPLLLITGLDFQMVWWPEAFCEQLVARGFAVVRFDNRDAGLSTHFSSGRKESPWRALLGRTKPAYSALDMLDDALAVMDAVGWPSAHVMGGSMGAGLAQALAALHPSRIRSLISCAGVPADVSPLRLLTYIKFGVFLKLRKLKPAPSREGAIDNLVAVYRAIASPGFPFPEAWACQVAAISYDRSPPDPTATQRQLAAGRACKLPPLSAITVPTLVISGEADPIIKLRAGRETARRISGSVFVSYPGMGHNLPEELWPDIIDRIAAVTRMPDRRVPPAAA